MATTPTARTRTPGAQPDVLMCELGTRDETTADSVLTGPGAPLPFVPTPDGGLPAWSPEDPSAAVWWVGCHGGAGESTLAALLPGSVATSRRWPAVPAGLPGRSAAVVLVARTSHAGLAAAQTALTQWAAGATPAVDLLGLVLSADAPGRLPRPLRDYARLVAGGAPRVWPLPWIDAWRAGEPAAPRPVARLLGAITALLPPGRFYPEPLPCLGDAKEGC